MEKQRQINTIISNLEMIVHKSNELIKYNYNTFTYSDFYSYYAPYVTYLKSENWETEDINNIVQSLPVLPKPPFRFSFILLSFLAAISVIVYFYVLLYIVPIALLLIARSFYIQHK